MKLQKEKKYAEPRRHKGTKRTSIVTEAATARRVRAHLAGLHVHPAEATRAAGLLLHAAAPAQIFAGMLPFMAIQVIAIILLYQFPAIGLWLPAVLYK